MPGPAQNEWCIVHRKHGHIEQVFPITEAVGDRAAVEAFRLRSFAPVYGGSTGKHTTSVERLADVRREEEEAESEECGCGQEHPW